MWDISKVLFLFFFWSSTAVLTAYSAPNIFQQATYGGFGALQTVGSTIGNTAGSLHMPFIGTNQNVNEPKEIKCQQYYPRRNITLGVAGGRKSLAKEFPHMAVIGYEGIEDVEWKCGASLISKKFVLTAAHCVVSKRDKPKYVRLGDLDLATEEDDAQPQNFTVTRIIPHPSYQPPAKYHDIALMELDREVDFSEYVSPACLNTEQDLKAPKLTATGWGRTGFAEDGSSFLLKVDLDHVPNDQCLVAFGKTPKEELPRSILDEVQICAGRIKGQDTCPGDSGGPLQMKNEKKIQSYNQRSRYCWGYIFWESLRSV
ncbi:hypothetical protein NQ315_008534 [Exocentrus adspersus]|uniref:Peptidase S1 domain-containing protein n=1 Tax=Exocentrus adspersus TaxID=1586481 RepID=A0AAV8W5K6_9CUCU|nr:hypothetical protein NQ315_008534 [Exocentrus adspersus]